MQSIAISQEAKTRRVRLSPLETLPAELHEKILFHSLNGNLLKSTQIIARKMSYSQTVKKAIFILAFYGDSRAEFGQFFKLPDLGIDTNRVLESHEKRSMLRAVLGSKWCTLSWLRSFWLDMVSYALHLMLAEDDSLTIQDAEEFKDKVRNVPFSSIRTLRLCGKWKDNYRLELRFRDVLSFVIIEVTASKREPLYRRRYWSVDTIDGLEPDIFPKLCLSTYHKQLKDQPKWDSYDPNTTTLGQVFKDNLHSLIRNGDDLLDFYMNNDVSRRRVMFKDMWEDRDFHMYTIRGLLETEYYMWPEDAPFQVNRRLFERVVTKHAVKAKKTCACCRPKRPLASVKVAAYLFSLDPSLLRETSTIRYWQSVIASESRRDVQHNQRDRRRRRDDLYRQQSFSQWSLDKLTEEAIADKKYLWVIDQVLSYISSGSSKDWTGAPVNSYSPNFSYNPFEDLDDVTVTDIDIYGDEPAIVQSNEGDTNVEVDTNSEVDTNLDDDTDSEDDEDPENNTGPEVYPLPAHLEIRSSGSSESNVNNFHVKEDQGVHGPDTYALDWVAMGITREIYPDLPTYVPLMVATIPEWAMEDTSEDVVDWLATQTSEAMAPHNMM